MARARRSVVLWVGLAACGQPRPPVLELEVDQCEALRREGPPATRREDVVDELHGVRVPDPYRWLEDGERSDVQTWMDAQDAYARATLQALPGRDALREALRAKIDVTSVSVPSPRGERLLYARREPGQDQAVWIVREGDGSERVLLDPMQLDPHGRAGIRSPVLSPDGRLVAYLVNRDGADAAVLHVRDVATGRDLPDTIAGARYATAAWTPDGTAFAYTALPDDPSIPGPELPSHATVKVHVLGTPVADDRVLFGPLGDAATFVGVQSVDGGRSWVLSLHHDWTATDLYVRPADPDAAPPWRPLFVGHGAQASVSATDGRFFVHTNLGAPRYRVVEIDPHQPEPTHWREVVPQRDDTLEAAPVLGGRLLLQYLRDASAALEIRELSGAPVAEVSLSGPAAVTEIAGQADHDAAYVSVSALHRAPSILELSMRTAEPRAWATSEVPVSDRLRVRQVHYPSRDGTQVSMFVLHRDDLRLDGTAPTLLTGYGGFGMSLQPWFSASAAVWAERGGVWAIANLRGGGEHGEAWHEAGRREHKQNSFDDFIAAAEYLQQQGYTRPSRLAIRGGSNGGLLVGAVSTQRPELYGAVVCAVPLLDMIRFHRFGAGPTWVGEYGSADDPEQFGWLWGYSPLHKVRPGVEHPPLLMLSADNDDRVHPMHARKYVAAMQHVGTDALLRIERGAGHGGSPRVGDRIEAEVDALSFVLHRLGVASDDGAATP